MQAHDSSDVDKDTQTKMTAPQEWHSVLEVDERREVLNAAHEQWAHVRGARIEEVLPADALFELPSVQAMTMTEFEHVCAFISAGWEFPWDQFEVYFDELGGHRTPKLHSVVSAVFENELDAVTRDSAPVISADTHQGEFDRMHWVSAAVEHFGLDLDLPESLRL